MINNTLRKSALCLLTALLALPLHAEKISIAATVGDDAITTLDVADRRALVMANASIPVTEENIQRITPRIIQLLVDETLQIQEAKRLSINVTDEEVDKAVEGLGAPSQPPGAIKQKIISEGLPIRSLKDQVRAQLAWSKVVQRKLRRNVNITQDELERAQQERAADPGTQEMRLAVIAIAVPSADKEAENAALAKEISDELAAGRDFPAIAEKYRARPNVQYNPLFWVTEERTPPELLNVLKPKQLGETLGPIRTGNIIQFIKVLERRVTKKPVASTEVLIKAIELETPPKTDRMATEKLAQSIMTLQQDIGGCDDATLPVTPISGKATFIRTTLGNLSPEQRSLIARLEVGGVSEPQIAPNKVQLVGLCERAESAGAAVDETLRQELYSEKLDLEAQKHLRNLRREATIDIRSGQ